MTQRFWYKICNKAQSDALKIVRVSRFTLIHQPYWAPLHQLAKDQTPDPGISRWWLRITSLNVGLMRIWIRFLKDKLLTEITIEISAITVRICLYFMTQTAKFSITSLGNEDFTVFQQFSGFYYYFVLFFSTFINIVIRLGLLYKKSKLISEL